MTDTDVNATDEAFLGELRLFSFGFVPKYWVTLRIGEMPSHPHSFNASNDLSTERQPPGQLFAQGDGVSAYAQVASATTMYTFAVAVNGQGGPHNNLMPFLSLSFCIALEGYWPHVADDAS